MSVKSIAKYTKTYYAPTLTGNGPNVDELIYQEFDAKWLLRKKVSSDYVFSEEDVEKLKIEIKKYRSRKTKVFVTENGLRMKVFNKTTKGYTRAFLAYKQIVTIYLTENILILGIVSANGEKRAYDCLKIKNPDDLNKFRSLLLKACYDDQKLVGCNPIGTLSFSSMDKAAPKYGSIGSLIWSQVDIDREDNSQHENDMHQKNMSSSKTNSVNNTSLSSTSIGKESSSDMKDGRKLSDSEDDKDLVKYHNGFNGTEIEDNTVVTAFDADNYNEALVTPIFHANSELPKAFYKTTDMNSHLENDDEVEDLYSPENFPAGVTFVSPDPVYGATISYHGPVYLYCERFTNDDDNSVENQTSA
ncbi:hypothetical protein MN116_002269 [Schistosoma mekongi]|uniref:Trematode PH-like domain-containing protein n=1 Tax=Schistosoma mekongi TaxID=38744 RepID=A0AAE1ZJU5_SCHME|nr:hypothetical protein MN116_002269 [Schistosoma mekongi]